MSRLVVDGHNLTQGRLHYTQLFTHTHTQYTRTQNYARELCVLCGLSSTANWKPVVLLRCQHDSVRDAHRDQSTDPLPEPPRLPPPFRPKKSNPVPSYLGQRLTSYVSQAKLTASRRRGEYSSDTSFCFIGQGYRTRRGRLTKETIEDRVIKADGFESDYLY